MNIWLLWFLKNLNASISMQRADLSYGIYMLLSQQQTTFADHGSKAKGSRHKNEYGIQYERAQNSCRLAIRTVHMCVCVC